MEIVRETAERVRVAVAAGEVTLVLGGDCTVGIGTVAGHAAAGDGVGLLYFDLHADLNIPESALPGALDWMGMAHMLGEEGAERELVEVGSRTPLLAPEQVVLLGWGRSGRPHEQDAIERLGLEVIPVDEVRADPAGAARALASLSGRFDRVLLHFDVDVIDFTDTPLSENPPERGDLLRRRQRSSRFCSARRPSPASRSPSSTPTTSKTARDRSSASPATSPRGLPDDPAESTAVEANPWQGFLWLSRRECHRVLRLWTQTTLAPVVSSLLFIVVFGLSLGGRIKQVQGFDYDEFIVPGLVAMAMAQAAYSNNASTIFQGRNDRFIDDVLAAPIHHWQVNVGYLIGGAFRALIIGVGLAALAIPITGAPVEQPALLIVAVLLLVVGFGALGTIVGIYAETFDHTSFINNIVILPLTFLGGVFYSVSRLGSPWEQLSHVNPLFYVVETIRYGFLGTSDVSPWIAFAVVAAMCLALLAWSQWLFTSGRKLKP